MSGTSPHSFPLPRPGLNYLVPAAWWKTLTLPPPPLSLAPHLDPFLLHYQTHLHQQLQHHCNFLTLHALRLNPEVSKHIEWTVVHPLAWAAVKGAETEGRAVWTIVGEGCEVSQTAQVQIVYCARTRTQAFVGNLPKAANLLTVVQQVSKEMGFTEQANTKVTFLLRSSQTAYALSELQRYSLSNAPDLMLLVFNLEYTPQQATVCSISKSKAVRDLNESNEAVMGDLNTMEDDSHDHLNERMIHNHTVSTGAETPFSFAFSEGFDLDREYRVKQLFGAKEPEEIEAMREKALQRVQGEEQLIAVSKEESEEYWKDWLDKWAQEMIVMSKKRSLKGLECQ